MDNKKYNVTILNTPVSETVINKLAGLFKIPSEKAQKIIQKESFVIKKQTDKKTAEKFHKAITAAGVNCRIDDITSEEDIELPAIEEIESNARVKPLTDITRPEIKPLHSDQMDLSLEARPVEKTTTDEEKVIEDIDPANFCPDCGTIRASADSVCIHCDYDPQVSEKKRKKAILIKASIAIIVIVAGIAAAFPFYQQYTRRMEIKDDLKLAFDTRNKVTAFIQKTNFWPNQNIDAGLQKQISNRSVKSVVVGDNAVITITLRAQVLDGDEQTLILTPNILKGQIVWNCLKGNLAQKFRPEICQPHTVE